MAKPRIFGADYSVYVRIVRLALAEKGIDYDLAPLDIFAEGGPPPDYLDRQPFARIPAFEHDGFALYETSAITRYIDEAFDGPALQPTDTIERARCNQLISIADNYAYPHLVWGIFVECAEKPAQGAPVDEAAIAALRPKAETCLKAMSDLMGDRPWLAGDALSLADLYAAPMMDYFLKAGEGRDMIGGHPNLQAWWSRIAGRPSMTVSEPT